VNLGRLLSAATRIIDDKESDDDLKLLLAPGASLGGARPVHSTNRSSSCRRPSGLQSDHQPHAERPPALHHHGRDYYEDDIDKALGVMRELMMGDPRAIADPPHKFIVQRDDGLDESGISGWPMRKLCRHAKPFLQPSGHFERFGQHGPAQRNICCAGP